MCVIKRRNQLKAFPYFWLSCKFFYATVIILKAWRKKKSQADIFEEIEETIKARQSLLFKCHAGHFSNFLHSHISGINKEEVNFLSFREIYHRDINLKKEKKVVTRKIIEMVDVWRKKSSEAYPKLSFLFKTKTKN